MAIQEQTSEAPAAVAPDNRARRGAPIVLLLAFVAVELAWVAVIGYVLYLVV